MSVKDFVIEDLLKIYDLIEAIDDSLFVEQLPILSNATIGQHIRHIMEFYQAVVNRVKREAVCYDDRRRDKELEGSRDKVKSLISQLQLQLSQTESDHPLTLKASYATEGNGILWLASSFERELAYTLEHSIHHQAMIKVGLRSISFDPEVVHALGVAPSTVRFYQDKGRHTNDLTYGKKRN